MFYYYGGKKRLAPLYPRPEHPTIIEPFAGGAGYAMHYLHRVASIVLIDSDERVIEAWEFILNSTRRGLRAYAAGLPAAREKTSDFLFMTMAASSGIARCNEMTVTSRMVDVAPSMLNRIAEELPSLQEKITLIHGDYTTARGAPATWFIDAPYAPSGRGSAKTFFPQGRGYSGGHSSDELDYTALGAWCRERPGQVIVCEQGGADWLPFEPLTESGDSQGRKAQEVVWMK